MKNKKIDWFKMKGIHPMGSWELFYIPL